MAPVRVGLIGLGPVRSAYYKAGEWGVNHLDAIVASPNLELVAVCNSSVESAQKSIDAHKLPSSVKAYGSIDDLGSDPNVDLIAVSVNIDKHYDLTKTAILHKKDVYIEFPASPTAAQTAELAALAKENGVRTIVGAQARASPVIRKLKELVASQAIGDVVYTNYVGHVPIDVSQGWPKATLEFLDINASISRIMISLTHPLDAFMHVLGGFQSVQSVFKVAKKTTSLLDDEFKVVERDYKITAPDTMLIQGVLDNGSTAAFSLRASDAPADGEGIRWIISGTEGEIVFTAPPGFVQMAMPGAKIVLRKRGGEAEEIDFSPKEGEHVAKVGPMSANILRVYEAFVSKDVDGFSNIDQSLETQMITEEVKRNAIWAH